MVELAAIMICIVLAPVVFFMALNLAALIWGRIPWVLVIIGLPAALFGFALLCDGHAEWGVPLLFGGWAAVIGARSLEHHYDCFFSLGVLSR